MKIFMKVTLTTQSNVSLTCCGHVRVHNLFNQLNCVWKKNRRFFIFWYIIIKSCVLCSYDDHRECNRWTRETVDVWSISRVAGALKRFTSLLLFIFGALHLCVFLIGSWFFPLCDDEKKPTVVGEIMSPMGAASVEFIDPREPIAVCLSPKTLFFSLSFFLIPKS